MDKVCSYAIYDEVICIYIDVEGNIKIYRSSNRKISIEVIKSYYGSSLINKEMCLYVGDILSKYFKICATKEPQRTAHDTLILSEIVAYIDKIGQELRESCEITIDKTQFLFITPFEYNAKEYENDLRSLFTKSRWLRAEDHPNNLIFSTFVDSLISYLQNINDRGNWKFGRERKYLLCSMMPRKETDEILFNITCFKMQNDKELSAVSRKLALSDLLLTPSILSSETIELPSIKNIISGRIKMIITDHAEHYIQHQEAISIITKEIINDIDSIYFNYTTENPNVSLFELLKRSTKVDLKQLQNLVEGLTCGNFITEVLNDPTLQSLQKTVCSKVNSVLAKFNNNAPDGIHDLVTYHSNSIFHYDPLFCKKIIQGCFVGTGVKTNNYFIGDTQFLIDDPLHNMSADNLCQGAMQKPYTMIHIVNSLLPPVILNQEHNAMELDENEEAISDIFPANTFYICAHMKEDHINFILNKVVQVRSANGIDRKSTFTVDQKKIYIDSIVDSIIDNMWSFFKSFDFEELVEHGMFLKCCEHQFQEEVTLINYHCFNLNFRKCVEEWSDNKSTTLAEELDTITPISIRNECNCAIQISQRMLLEIGLMSAIKTLATAVLSALELNKTSEFYNISVLVITGCSERFKNTFYQYHFSKMFFLNIQQCLQAQGKRIVVFFSKEELVSCRVLGNWVFDAEQLLQKGEYTQASSTTYMFRFKFFKVQNHHNTGIYLDDGESYKKLGMLNTDEAVYTMLKAEGSLPHKGITRRFIYHGCRVNYIVMSALFSPQYELYSRSNQRISSFQALNINHTFPLTFKIDPNIYSSAVQFDVSYVTTTNDPIEIKENLLSIHERLTLKKDILYQ